MNKDKWLNENIKNLSERDYALITKARNILLGNIMCDESKPWYPYRCITPSKTNFLGIWNWDTAFHAIGVLNWDTQLAKEQILGFIQYQLDNGMYIDVKWHEGFVNDKSSKPPVMAWAVQRVYQKDKDIEFIKKVYPSLVKNESYWTNNRLYDGLFHYDANTNVTPLEEYDLNVRYESGWDNSVRWDKPCSDFWAIDLNCFAVMMYRALSDMAFELGQNLESAAWRAKANVLTENIEKNLWNDDINAYVDVNRFNGTKSNVLSPASFMPLYIKSAPADRAKYMADIASNKEKFYPGMPTVSYDNEQYSLDYWRGPTWLNVAYFAAKGLKNYGYTETANAVKNEILGWVYNDGDCIHENYDSKTGKGLFNSTFSWSSAFVIEFILDF